MDEEEAAGREGWWMWKVQQEGKVGGCGRNSRKGSLMDEELVDEEGTAVRKVGG
jgi:hypothetical protein